MFGDNAVNVADELDLTLTGRDFGLKERVPMIGFPYHVSDAYFNKLTKKHSVYVIENDKEYEYKNNEIPPNIDRETGEILFNDKKYYVADVAIYKQREYYFVFECDTGRGYKILYEEGYLPFGCIL